MPHEKEDERERIAAPSTPDRRGGLEVTLDETPGNPGDMGRLGRLRLERLLGCGGMGAVFEAFDPDLERRVAVKVLHARSSDGRTRLLREARAMAKLSHPNVIAVFDVGTVDGTDFVVMELIDGETLDVWKDRARPGWREIVATFVQAGRGLAAAHAAALVHRDFKPSNALRAHDGRIVVTDFGLSGGVAAGGGEGLGGDGPDARGNAGLGALTAPGALLGTPAYMAPEQWRGEPVSPATDQFAFCVALAELLTGARPHHGDSMDEVRAGALAGPGALAGVPGAVRASVRRGLAVEPAARWPSMTALLDALERALRRRGRIAVAVAGAVVAAGIATAVGLARTPAGDDCLAAAIDPGAIVTRTLAPEVGAVLETELATWREQRRKACGAPVAVRAAQLSCLDGGIARLALATRLAAEHPLAGPMGVEGVGGILADTTSCTRDRPPRLASTIAPELARSLADYRLAIAGEPLPIGTSSTLPTTPCAAAVALRARLVARTGSAIDVADLTSIDRDASEAAALGRRCVEDDLARAIGEGDGADPGDQLSQADLIAELDVARARQLRADQPSAATALYEEAARKYGTRHRPRSQVRAILGALDVLLARGSAADLARVDELVARWRSTGIADDARELDDRAARARWRRGEVAAADAALLAIGAVRSLEPPLRPVGPEHTVTGIVVDTHGRPVAGAEVASGAQIDADSALGVSPFTLEYGVRTRTEADGQFVLPRARGPVTAWTATAAAPMLEGAEIRLVLEPTHRVRGNVDLSGIAATSIRVELSAVDTTWTVIAPILADGRFELDHVRPGRYRASVQRYGTVVGAEGPMIEVRGDVDELRLTARPAQPFAVIARSIGFGAPDLALLFAFRGKAPAHATVHSIDPDSGTALVTTAWAYPPSRVSVTESVRSRLADTDVVGAFGGRPSGPMFVCAAGLSAQMYASLSGDAYWQSLGELDVHCVDVAETDTVVVVELPATRRRR